mgnify:FL=1
MIKQLALMAAILAAFNGAAIYLLVKALDSETAVITYDTLVESNEEVKQ